MDFNMYKILAVYGLSLLATAAFFVNKGPFPWFNVTVTETNHPSIFLVLMILAVGLVFWII